MLSKIIKSGFLALSATILSATILSACNNGSSDSPQLSANSSKQPMLKNSDVLPEYIPFADWKQWEQIKDGSDNSPVTHQIVYQGKLFTAFADGSLKSYDGSKWQTIYEKQQQFPVVSQMIVFQGNLYIGLSTGRIDCFDGNTYKTIANDFSAVDNMLIYNDTLVVARRDVMVTQLQGAQWQILRPSTKTFSSNKIVVYHNKLFIGLANGNVEEWDGNSWKLLPGSGWQQSVTQMLSYDDKLIVGLANGAIKAWDGNSWKDLQDSSWQQPIRQMLIYHDKLIIGLNNGSVKKWGGSSWQELQGTGWNATINSMTLYNDSVVVGLSNGEVRAWNESANKWFLLQNNGWGAGVTQAVVYNKTLMVGLGNGAIEKYGTERWTPKYSDQYDPIPDLAESKDLHDMDCYDSYIIPDVSPGEYITKQEIKVCALATTLGVYLGFAKYSSNSSYPTEWTHIKHLGEDPGLDIHGVVVTSYNADTGRVVQVGNQLNNVREPIVRIVGIGENGKAVATEFNPYEVYNNESNLSRIYTTESTITSYDLYQAVYTSESKEPAYLAIGRDARYVHRSLDGENWSSISVVPNDREKFTTDRLRRIYEHIARNGAGVSLNAIKCGFREKLYNRCVAVGDFGIILVSNNSGESWLPAYNADPKLWYNNHDREVFYNNPQVGDLYSISSKYSVTTKKIANVVAGPHTLLYSANLAAWNPIQLPEAIADENAYFSIFDVTVAKDIDVVKDVNGQLTISKEDLFIVRLMLPDGSLSDITMTSEDGISWTVNDVDNQIIKTLHDRQEYLDSNVIGGFKKNKIVPPLPGMPYFIYSGVHSNDSFAAIGSIFGKFAPMYKLTPSAALVGAANIALTTMLKSDNHLNREAHMNRLIMEAMTTDVPDFFKSLDQKIVDAYKDVENWFNSIF